MKEHLIILWTGLWRMLIPLIAMIALVGLFVWLGPAAILVIAIIGFFVAAYIVGKVVRDE